VAGIITHPQIRTQEPIMSTRSNDFSRRLTDTLTRLGVDGQTVEAVVQAEGSGQRESELTFSERQQLTSVKRFNLT
jgi:hypothetical protein